MLAKKMQNMQACVHTHARTHIHAQKLCKAGPRVSPLTLTLCCWALDLCLSAMPNRLFGICTPTPVCHKAQRRISSKVAFWQRPVYPKVVVSWSIKPAQRLGSELLNGEEHAFFFHCFSYPGSEERIISLPSILNDAL